MSLLAATRPANSLLLGLLAGYSLVAEHARAWSSPTTLSATCAWILLAGAAYALNDLMDVAIDRVNRPDRYIPAGGDPRRLAALVVSVALAGVGVATAAGPRLGTAATSWLALTFTYSLLLKPRLGATANAVAALAVSAALLPGAAMDGATGPLTGLGIGLFLVMLAREILKDIEDVEGDQCMQRRTLPMRIGPRRAGAVAALIAIGGWLWLWGARPQGLPGLAVAGVSVAGLVDAAVWGRRTGAPKIAVGIQRRIRVLAVAAFLPFLATTVVR